MLKYLSTFMLLLSLVWLDLNAQDTPAADCWAGRLFVKIKDNAYVMLPDYDRQKNAGKVVQYPVLGPLLEQFEVEKITHAFPLLRSTTFDNTYEVHFDTAKSTDEFVRLLAANPTVEYAEKVPIDRLCYDPNDPKEGDGTQWSLNTIQAQAAWDINVGSSAVTVAIVDDAILTTHEDLAGALWVNTNDTPGNGIDDDGDGYIDNINGWDCADSDNNTNPPATASATSFGHGTHCAGIAGATTNNAIGVASIGNGIKIMPIKCTSNSSADPSIITHGWTGVQCAIASGADIISLSWGSTVYSSTYQNLVNYAESQGVVMVAAAGNAGNTSPFYPAGYDICIGVAATTSSDTKASYSNYGSWVDVSAPGSSIYGVVPSVSNNTYANKSGTSMATPLTAGLLGLMLSNDASLTPSQLRSCLFSSTVNINTQNASYSGMLGAGRINAASAVGCVASLNNATSTSCNAPGNIAASNVTSNSATLSWAGISGANSYGIRYRAQGLTIWSSEQTTTSTSLAITGLAASTTYELQARSICGSSSSSYSSISTFITPASTCSVPTNLVAANLTNSTATISWAAISGASSYTVRFRVSGGAWSSDISTAATSVTLSGLTSSTTYEVQAKTVCSASSSSAYTSSATFSTTAPVCNTPTNLTSGSITQNSAMVSWTTVSGASSYTVRFRMVGGTWGADIGVSSGTTAAITGLTASTNYEFQVKTNCSSSNSSAYTNSATFVTTAPAATCNPPANLSSSSVTSSGATVSWTAVSGASNYTVNVRAVGSSTWGSDISATSTSTALSGLTASTNYEFQVKTNCSTSSSSAYATAATFTTAAATTTSCGVPTGLSASNIASNSATLSWNTLSGATSYTLRYRRSGTTTWTTTTSTTTSKSVTGLLTDNLYECQVRATCGTSNGSYSASSTFTPTAATTCNAPTNLSSSSVTSSGATVSWSAVSGASNYTVNVRAVGGSTWGSDISATSTSTALSGLTASTNYEFQVKTNCSASSSSAYATAATFTTTAVACATPANLSSSSVTSSGATVSWTAVSGASNYTVNVRAVGSSTWGSDISATSTSTTLSGLTASTNYEFQVKTNCSTSSSSAYATAATFTTAAATTTSCGVPTGLSASNIASNSATLSWNTLSGATSYALRYRRSGTTTWTTTTSTTTSKSVTGLLTGNLYECQVRATCGTSNGSYSASITFTPTAATTCNTPTNLSSSSVTSSGATVSWTAVSGASNYTVNVRVLGSSTWGSDISTASTSTALSGLTASTNYEFQVKTNCSASSSSAYATAATFTTTAVACTPPANLSSSSVTSSGATVSWTAVSGASNYTVNVRAVGSSTWGSDISTASTSTALSGLTASTNYEFQVKTNCSTSSSSAYATAATFTTAAATTTSCGVPTGLAASSITGSGFTMTWNTVSGATSYTLRYRVSGATSWITSASSTTSKTISGLTPGASYDTQVKAICGTSNGSYSSTILVVMPATTQSFDEEYEGDTGGSSYGAEDNQCPDMDIAFDYTVSNGTVSFDDQSMIDYAAFLWNFGDGDFAETRHPTHHYAENGTYLFEVHVTDKSGCVGNFSGFVYITDDGPSDDMIDATQLKDFNR